MFAEACAAQRADAELARASSEALRGDVPLHPDDEPSALLADLDRLEPCGEGNAAAQLSLPRAHVVSSRIMKGEHLRLVVRYGGRLVDAFGFQLAHHAPRDGALVDLRGSLKRDLFRGRSSVELRLSSVCLAVT
jgi:single-stranded-DNA-specific exonuclease